MILQKNEITISLFYDDIYFIKNHLTWFGDKELESLYRRVNNPIFLKRYSDVLKFIRETLRNKKEESFVGILGKIDDEIANKIYRFTNFNLKNYAFCFSNKAFSHIYEKHYLGDKKIIDPMSILEIPKLILYASDIKLYLEKHKMYFKVKVNDENYMLVVNLNVKMKTFSICTYYMIGNLGEFES